METRTHHTHVTQRTLVFFRSTTLRTHSNSRPTPNESNWPLNMFSDENVASLGCLPPPGTCNNIIMHVYVGPNGTTQANCTTQGTSSVRPPGWFDSRVGPLHCRVSASLIVVGYPEIKFNEKLKKRTNKYPFFLRKVAFMPLRHLDCLEVAALSRAKQHTHAQTYPTKASCWGGLPTLPSPPFLVIFRKSVDSASWH